MITKLTKLANHLDRLGLYAEADAVDAIIKSAAEEWREWLDSKDNKEKDYAGVLGYDDFTKPKLPESESEEKTHHCLKCGSVSCPGQYGKEKCDKGEDFFNDFTKNEEELDPIMLDVFNGMIEEEEDDMPDDIAEE